MSKKILSIQDYQILAKERLESGPYGYFVSGSDDEITLKNNINAFSKIYLSPRVLVDVSNICMKTSILNHQLDLPFGIAPFAMQKLLHPKGELLSAKQAQNQNTAFGSSMLSTTKPGDVVKVNPTGLKILQLYFMKNASYTIQILRLAQKLGFAALAITVDTQIFGKRRRDERTVFQPQVTLELFNELGYNFKMRDVQNLQRSFVHQIKNDISWEDIKWIKKNTYLKIILKGIISSEDIEMAQRCQVDALWISNHGGRQLDTAPATILAVPSFRAKLTQLKSKMELYVDGGVKTGTDIFRCLALGADFVFLGRGFLFSLIDGEKGIQNAFKILKQELKIVMSLCGTTNIKSINQDYILKYPKAKL